MRRTTLLFLTMLLTGCEGPATEVLLPLVVANWYPSGNATCLPPDTGVFVTFSEPVEAASITEASVSLTKGTAVVAAWGRYDPENLTVELWPELPLELDCLYTVRLTTAVRTPGGARLGTELTSSFTTVAQSGCANGLECGVHADCLPQRCSITGICVDECAVPGDCPPGETCGHGACNPG